MKNKNCLQKLNKLLRINKIILIHNNVKNNKMLIKIFVYINMNITWISQIFISVSYFSSEANCDLTVIPI